MTHADNHAQRMHYAAAQLDAVHIEIDRDHHQTAVQIVAARPTEPEAGESGSAGDTGP